MDLRDLRDFEWRDFEVPLDLLAAIDAAAERDGMRAAEDFVV
jgi:hypothetical protein